METESMIRSLRVLYEKHKSDAVSTCSVNWASLCFDVANRLEELNNENLKFKKQLQILTEIESDNN